MNIETIKKNYEFRKVYKKGKSIVGKYLVVYYLKNNKFENRIGITVSKKVGNSVIRNKVRRLIKESIIKFDDFLLQGYDIVIVARVAASKANYSQIYTNLNYLLDVFKKKGESNE